MTFYERFVDSCGELVGPDVRIERTVGFCELGWNLTGENRGQSGISLR
jgi:hypothetical protein